MMLTLVKFTTFHCIIFIYKTIVIPNSSLATLAGTFKVYF